MNNKKFITILMAGALCLGSVFSTAAADFSDGSSAVESIGESDNEVSESPIDDQSWTKGEFSSFQEGDNFTNQVADVFSDGNFTYEYISSSDSYRITKGIDQEDVVIPDTYQDKPVTEIGENAFAGFQRLNKVTLPDNITIRKNAFAGCSYLHSVRVDSPVTIQSGAFADCPRLVGMTTVDWPEQVNGAIAPDAFDKDTKVIIFGYGLSQEIIDRGIYITDLEADDSFYKTAGLSYYLERMIDFDNSYSDVIVSDWHPMAGVKITTIGRKAFYGCERVRSVVLPDTIKNIETKAFYGCSGLQKIVIPKSVTSISEDAFANASQVSIWAPTGSYAAKFAKSHGIPLNQTSETPQAETVKVTVNKNMVTAAVSEYTGDGYDCIMGTETRNGRPIRGTGKLASKQTGKQVIFRNVPKGIYYLAIRSYENIGSVKKYGPWSEIKPVKISVNTPARPKIKSAKVSGKNLTVNVSLPKGTAGYNLALGKATIKNDSSAASILRPTKIAYQKKGQKKASVKLTNLKKGTYYIGIQTYNYQNGKKVYSQWSPLKNAKIS